MDVTQILIGKGEAWELARGWYQDRLKPDRRRHTPEETEQLLASTGLVGDFWSVR